MLLIFKCNGMKLSSTLIWLSFILISLQIHRCFAVKGCVTFLSNFSKKPSDKHFKKSICNNKENQFEEIPTALPPQVAFLTISNQRLSLLNRKSFSHLQQLRELILDDNRISLIEADTFSNTPHLEILSLRGNNLKLGKNSFIMEALSPLIKLTKLDLQNNPIGFIPNGFFSPLRNLKVLVLSHAVDGLKLADDAFEGLHQLEELDLSMNLMVKLSEKMKDSLNLMQLKKFFLFGNKWDCDCKLRWLSLWFRKKSKPVQFSDKRKVGQPPFREVEFQPICSSPPNVKGHYILSSEAKSISLTQFHCKPVVYTRGQLITVNEMSNVTMSCHFRADPRGNVTWYRDSTLVQPHWKRVRISSTQGIDFKSTLTIESVQKRDAGKWICNLVTQAGIVNASYTLAVIKPSVSGLEVKRAIMFAAIAVLVIIVLLITAGGLIFCFYGRTYMGNGYNVGKRRQMNASEPGMSNWAYSQAMGSANNTVQRDTGIIHEEIMGGGGMSNTTLTPRKRVMISQNSVGQDEILHHESVPLTAGITLDNGALGQPDTDLSMMQQLEINSTLRVNPNPGYLPTKMVVAVPSDIPNSASVIATGSLTDGCPVHGLGLRPAFNPCPVHGETLSRSQTPQVPISMPTTMYNTLPCGAYKPCPLHGDLLATMQRSTAATTNNQAASSAGNLITTTASITSTPTTTTSAITSSIVSTTPGPTRGILRSKSPPKQPRSSMNASVTISAPSITPTTSSSSITAVNTAANASRSTFVRASQVDDCLDTTPFPPPPPAALLSNEKPSSVLWSQNSHLTSSHGGRSNSSMSSGSLKDRSNFQVHIDPETMIHKTPDGEAYATAM